MTKEELLKELDKIFIKQKSSMGGDFDHDHISADQLLLTYINDPEIYEAFDKIEKWYS